jgi:hypothetical protein
MSKPFSKKLYADDDNAKYQVVEWLKRCKYDARVNPDTYGVDVLATKNGKNYCFEVEVKHNWTGTDFPFSNVHFSGRKQKFIKPSTYFTMLNHKRNRIMVVDYDALQQAIIVKKNTIYTSDERFIEVPFSSCMVYKILSKGKK